MAHPSLTRSNIIKMTITYINAEPVFFWVHLPWQVRLTWALLLWTLLFLIVSKSFLQIWHLNFLEDLCIELLLLKSFFLLLVKGISSSLLNSTSSRSPSISSSISPSISPWGERGGMPSQPSCWCAVKSDLSAHCLILRLSKIFFVF